MTMDIFAELAELDPAREPGAQPDWDAMAPALLSALDERTQLMQTQEPLTPSEEKPTQRRRWIAAAATFVVILLAGIAFIAANRTTDSPSSPDPQPTTTVAPDQTDAALDAEGTSTTVPAESPEAVAARFIEAVGADSATALALVADDATVDAAGLDDIADLEAWLAWNEAIGWRQTFDGCGEAAEGLRCRYTFINPWMEAVGSPPASGSTIKFTIEDGLIVGMAESMAFSRFEPAHTAFLTWLDSVHPGDRDRILTADGQPILTPESTELWDRYTDEFVRTTELEATGNRFLDALLSPDPLALDALIASEGRFYTERWLQAWMAALDNRPTSRACRVAGARLTCTMESVDELGDLLGITYSDRFSIDVDSDGAITTVRWSTSSTPPDAFDAYDTWLRADQPELFAEGGPCFGFFQLNPTRADACALAWLEAAPTYLAETSGG